MTQFWPKLVLRCFRAPSFILHTGWLVIILIGITGCENAKPRSSAAPIRCWLMTDSTSMDPRISGTLRPQAILSKLFEGLMRLDGDGVPQLGLAQSITISQDKKTYTFSLRPSRWSNSAPLTAHDFAAAWKSIISRDVQTKHVSAFFCIKNAKKAFEKNCDIDQVGIRVLDDLTLQVELEHPASYFLEWAANPLYSPVSHSYIAKKTTMDSSKSNKYICNGPYMISKRIINQRIDLVKNPYYWNASAIDIEGIQFSILPDATTGYNLFCKDELDWFGEPFGSIPPDIAETLIRQGRYTVHKTGSSTWIRCNVRLRHLSSKKIRRALACAINREEISTNLLQNLAFPLYSIVSSKKSLLDQPTFSDHDVETARKLFAEGLVELGYTQETFPDLTLSCRAEQKLVTLCELISQQLHTALGINVKIQIIERSLFLDDLFHCRLEISLSDWISCLNDPIYNLASLDEIDGGYKTTGWENQAYTEILKASNMERDPQKRSLLLKSAEELIMEEMPCIPIIEIPFFYAKQSNVQEDFFTGIGLLDHSRYSSKEPFQKEK